GVLAGGRGRGADPGETEQVRAGVGVEPQRAGERLQHLRRRVALAALLEADVVVDADAGDRGHLLAAEPGHPPVTERRQPGLLRGDPRTAGPQVVPEQVLGHRTDDNDGVLGEGGCVAPRLGAAFLAPVVRGSVEAWTPTPPGRSFSSPAPRAGSARPPRAGSPRRATTSCSRPGAPTGSTPSSPSCGPPATARRHARST